jgi:diguanylate cyclase (GGDEF)-like protein
MTALLHHIILFEGLSAADLDQISAYLKPCRRAAGETIFSQNDSGAEVFFIEQGNVVVFDPSSPGVSVRNFSAGSMFGELAVIDRKPRTLSARADTECQLWIMPAEDFERLILDNKTLLMKILINLSGSIRYTTSLLTTAMHQSIRDSLTGLYNRSLYESLVSILEEGHREQVTVVIIDIDGLKETNDTLGHSSGDRLIQRTASILRSAFRPEDIIARIGGDEFAVLLPGVSATTAEAAFKRIWVKLDEYNLQNPDYPTHFSAGVATGGPDIPIAAIIQQADVRMYAHKKVYKAQLSNAVPAHPNLPENRGSS